MLKETTNTSSKRGSSKELYQGPLASSLNRRAFLKSSIAITLLSGFTGCKPSVPDSNKKIIENLVSAEFSFKFPAQERLTLSKVLMHLFPADGNGPSAEDLNALNYLEWALTDEKNIADGDPEYIVQGVGWLEGLSESVKGDKFVKLNNDQQHQLLEKISQSRAGENWMSLLIYYLTEALLLDPVYGGNTNRVGWDWLQHQSGFPQPVLGKTYRDFV